MPRKCSVCHHDDRDAIDAAVIGGAAYRDVARRYDLSKDAVARHRESHLSPALVALEAEREADGGRTAHDRLEGLYLKAERILAAAMADGKPSVSLAAIRELRQTCELLAKLTGELDDRPVTVNVLTSPEWLQVRGAVLGALAAHPEAQRSVADALAVVEARPELEAGP